MRKIKQKTVTVQAVAFKFRRRALVSALAAAGLISVVPGFAAALPTPCAGGCGPSANLSFVQAGSAAISSSGTVMSIQQRTPTAILNWRDFNIAQGNSVNFKQYQADGVTLNNNASALNRIWDANPTLISGSLTANGQIYLINRNGIVFGGGAQVNAGALVASSLDINDSLYQAGYVTNTRVSPAFGDGVNGIHGFVKVDSEAVLNGSRIMLFAPVVENSGSISTPGGQTILAAGSKVYLEASRDPNLRGMLVEVDVASAGVVDPLRVGRGLQHAEAGVVSNIGSMLAERGNITLAGFAVNQQGRISATTSVTENGSIKLLARYNVAPETVATQNASLADKLGLKAAEVYDIRATQTGKVTLATGSVTQVVPELADAATSTDGQRFKQSIVEAVGHTIEMQSGSRIVVPGGKVTLAAISSYVPEVVAVPAVAATLTTPAIPAIPGVPASGLIPAVSGNSVYQEIAAPTKDNVYKDNTIRSTSFINPGYSPLSAVADTARVFLDSGSVIDVSGSQANLSVARNILTVQLRGSQLQDAPVQRSNRFLWGKDVQIDIRRGSTLANYASEEAQIARTVAERSAAGGSVKLVSTGDVVVKSGAKVDLSGGKINYDGANIKTTALISHGVVYDIASAPPDRIYDGISGSYAVTHNKWGITETFNTLAGGDVRGRWDAGYTEGKAAGTLTVLAPHAVLNGDIVANTVAGSYQRLPVADSGASGNYKNSWQMRPLGGALVIGDSSALPDSATRLVNYITDSNVLLQAGAPHLAGNFTLFDPLTSNVAALPTNFLQDIALDDHLFSTAAGLNRLEVYGNKGVSVAAGTALQLAAGGAITLKGQSVNMLGSIDTPSGTVKIATAVTTASTGTSAGVLNIGADGTASHISTRGQWVHDMMPSGLPDLSKPLLINGGKIALNSGGDLLLAAGTLLDASGGAWLDSANKLHGGNGGAIELNSGESSIPFKAQLDGLDLRSYGTAGGKGGALTIRAGDIALGATANGAGALVLPEAFFQRGGFSSYNLTAQGLNGLTVNAGAVIAPKAQSLILDRTASLRGSGAEVTSFANVGLLPDWQRSPVSIMFKQTNGGALKVEAGAVVRVDPTASISLNAANQLTVLGTLEAPAGSITLDLEADPTNYYANQSIWLGSQSRLLSQGYFLKAQPNAQNLTQGQVLAGGKINIASNTGYVVAQAGSLMDVSGISANLDLPQLVAGSLAYRSSHVAGDAGAISMQTGAGALFDGNMKAGVEAGSQAAAGKFSLTLNNNPGIGDPQNPGMYPLAPAQIQVLANGNGGFASQAGLTPGNDANAGRVSLTALAGKALLDGSSLPGSGFDQVMLKSGNSIVLADQVNLQTRRSITLDAPQLIVSGSSTLSSAHVTLGNLDKGKQALLDPLGPVLDPLNPIKYLNPVMGSGTLNVSGQLVDLTGNFIASGINQFNVVNSGDVRLNGVIHVNDPNNKSDLIPTSLQGNLRTQANISLQADQVYPTTLAQFKLSVEDNLGNPAGNISVLPGQYGASPVLSAGGQLTLSAADIVQNGVIKAPLGTLNLNGSQSVTLAAGSMTSVAADGLTIPFGVIAGGKDWKYDLTGAGADTSTISTTPPQKQLKFSAPNIAIQSGATVNLSGGGDLYAYEFFAGNGGSTNVLDPAKAPANTFAILPGMSGFAPYDPQSYGQYVQNGSKTALQSDASVYLAGGAGINAGYYTLLPASYALLPGAYRVTAVSGYSDRQPGQGVGTLIDGTQIMAGKFAATGTGIAIGTGIQDARYSGFAVTPGSVVRTQSEYHDSYANQFFAAQAAANGTAAPRSPLDAGQLVISAVGSGATLALDGTFMAQPGAGGRGSLVDLSGPGFAIVNSKVPGNGLMQLTTDSLNRLGAESLLIGGVRTQNAHGVTIAVGADQVVVDNAGSALQGPEIILAANTAVTVKSGSKVQGTGSFSGQASDITIDNASLGKNDNGALLRVASGPQVTVARTNADLSSGTLSIENNATLGAQNNALLLDSSYATAIANTAALNGNAFSVAAQSIDIGANPAPAATSLALSGALLTQALTFKNLTLHSYSDLNFYGAGFLGGLDANQQHILNNLVLNSRSLNGLNNAGQTNLIDAANVTLLNNNSGISAATGYGAGNLKINADQIVIADGNKAIQGFDNVTLAASKQILAQGSSIVTVNSGDANIHHLVLQAGQISATNKANLTITANNDDIAILPVAGATAAASEALNAKLTIVGKSIADNGVINLPSGSIVLHATGAGASDGVTLGSGSTTSAAGLSKTIAGQTVYAQAGGISLIADNGGVDIQGGAVVDVSGAAGGGDAGSLNIAASKGAVSVAGNLQGGAAAGNAQGSFTLDSYSLNGSGNTLTGLNDILSAGGFTGLRDMRIRSGNLVLAADAPGTVRARAQTFRLAADLGTIDVFGTVDSSGSGGGNILLAARGNVTLNAGALLDAHASGAEQPGGKVALETTVGDINLMAPTGAGVPQIDVHGSSTGGSVLLRAPRNITNNDVAINTSSGTSLNVSPNAKVTVEAFKTFQARDMLVAKHVAATSIYKTNATAFANNAAAIKSRLGMSLADSNLHLTPGIELYSLGDVTLAANWDLSGWRFNDGNGLLTEPGILTLRAGGNLNFGSGTTTASLTDGFISPNPIIVSNTKAGGNPTGGNSTEGFPTITPTTGASWSYRLVAGADLNGADVMAVNNMVPAAGSAATTAGNVVLVAGSEKMISIANTVKTTYTMEQIRTGTGFIDIAAGGSLNLGNRDSVIYTAGQAATGVPVTGTNKYFGVNGGDISIRVKGDVNGAATDQLINDWLWRQGLPNPDGTIATQPAWWVNLQGFRQNIGALGGGNVSVSAGGNINTLSAVAPTTGYVDMVNPAHPTVVIGGGNLSVTAGGDINSGVFYVGNGQGSILAGGDLGTSRADNSNKLYTILALGQGRYDVRTGGDLKLQTVLNPTMVSQGTSQFVGIKGLTVPKSYFFTYGDTSGVSLSSLGGDVSLFNNGSVFYESAYAGQNFFMIPKTAAAGATNVYPGTLRVSALGGSILSPASATLFPSVTGDLQLIAAKDIQLGLVMSDADPSGFQANTATTFNSNTRPVYTSLLQNFASGHSSLHAQDKHPVIVSAGGSISGNMTLPKSAQIQAGQDVKNLELNVQNLNSTDTTSIVAGRDIVYISAANSTTSPAAITVTGPGQVVLQAGRNVDLGQSTGVITKGNLTNVLLPEQGAGVTVLAGVGQGATATQSFIDKYMSFDGSTMIASGVEFFGENAGKLYIGSGHTKLYTPYSASMRNIAETLQSLEQAFAYFNTLSKPLQEVFVRQAFFSKLRQFGRIAAGTSEFGRNVAGSGNYSSGYDAIATLFPSAGYKGDVNLYYSQIKTERGGDINILTPGGGVNAGLANPSANDPKKEQSELGIVTVKGGDVNAFVNNDFMVNQSRVFTLQGGNILMWSSNGNIDAGKGSKSVSSTPPPLLIVDPKTGTFNVDVTQSVVGSGIRVLLANKDVVPGTVDLFAPRGDINAGDAGIGAAGNIFLGALHVVGADNINFGGTSVGVPVAAPAPVSMSGIGNMQEASTAAGQATQGIGGDMAKLKDSFKPSMLSVEVIGLGD